VGRKQGKINMKKTPTKIKKPNKRTRKTPQNSKTPNKSADRRKNPYDHQPNSYFGEGHNRFGICE
jgi:hypothetical protein